MRILTSHSLLCSKPAVRADNTTAADRAATNRHSSADKIRARSSRQPPESIGPKWVRRMMCTFAVPSVSCEQYKQWHQLFRVLTSFLMIPSPGSIVKHIRCLTSISNRFRWQCGYVSVWHTQKTTVPTHSWNMIFVLQKNQSTKVNRVENTRRLSHELSGYRIGCCHTENCSITS